jgi:hypothetical protein
MVFGAAGAAFAQAVPSPVPAPSGVAGVVASKGGIVGLIIAVMLSMNILMSGARAALAKWDGVDLGQPIPDQYKGLTLINKICLVLGKGVDFITSNLPH